MNNPADKPGNRSTDQPGTSSADPPPLGRLYFILGCTACGKGAVGRALARRLGAQILSVDSMKVYRRMDIGTAKPSAAIRAEIPHHGIDLVEPWESFSVAQYVQAADRAVEAIRGAGAIPLAVGGTSLYIKALAEGLFTEGGADPEVRAEFEARADAEGLPALHAELSRVDAPAAARIHPNDRKRILRALEVYRLTGRPISSLQTQWDLQRRYDCVLIGLRRDKDEQSRRINLRATRMVQAGLRDEVAGLLADPHGLAPQAAQAVGYAEMIEHLAGRCGLEDALEQIKINTRRLAKKQRTWHRRWMDVHWFDLTGQDDPDAAAEQILRQVRFV